MRTRIFKLYNKSVRLDHYLTLILPLTLLLHCPDGLRYNTLIVMVLQFWVLRSGQTSGGTRVGSSIKYLLNYNLKVKKPDSVCMIF